MSSDGYGVRQLEILRDIHGPRSVQLATRLAQALELALTRLDWPAALDFGRELLEVQRVLQPGGDETTRRAARGVGQALRRRGELAAAVPVLGQAIALDRTLGAPAHELAEDLLALAHAVRGQGELARAEALATEAAAALEAAASAGAPHPVVAELELLRLELAAEAGDEQEVLLRLARCRQGAAGLSGPAALQVVRALEQSARQVATLGRPAGGVQLAAAAVDLAREQLRAAAGEPGEALVAARWTLAHELALLGDLRRKAGDLAGARTAWEEALEQETTGGGDRTHEAGVLMNNLGAACWELGDLARGHDLVRRANKLFAELHGMAHPHTQASGKALIMMLKWFEEQRGQSGS